MNRIFVFILLFTLLSCKKAEERTCLKSTGKSISVTKDITKITSILVYDDLNVELLKDTVDFVEIESYKNLINNIEIINLNGELILRNNNKCNLFRKYEKQNTVTVHYAKLEKVSLFGKGYISTVSSIVEPKFHLYAHSCNSEINLSIQSDDLIVEFINGTLSGAISGGSKNAYFFHSGYSNVNFSALNTTKLRVINKSYSDTYVNASVELLVEIYGLGNVYYKGLPTINKSEIGKGKLIKYNK